MIALNQVTVSGRLTGDPTIRYTPNGAAVLNFNIAIPNRYLKDGQWVNTAYFYDVVAWNKLAENWKDRLQKGMPIVLEGKLASRKVEEHNGYPAHTKHEIMANRIQQVQPTQGSFTENQSNEDPFD